MQAKHLTKGPKRGRRANAHLWNMRDIARSITRLEGIIIGAKGEIRMSAYTKCKRLLIYVAIPLALFCIPGLVSGQNQVMGQVDFQGATKLEKSSGVWIDGQYVGYLKELKGSKKILLLPGEHEVSVRQGGYVDFVQKVTVRGGETQTVDVRMEKDTRIQFPQITAEIKLEVNPN